MELLRDVAMMDATVTEKEAQEHNALIKERYRRLQNAEASQFAEKEVNTIEENTLRSADIARANTVYAPVFERTSAIEQTPQVTEYVRANVAEPIFTAEKFERLEETAQENNVMSANVTEIPVSIPVSTPVMTTENAMAERYSLTTFAKMMITVFATLVLAMLTLICINTYTINQKTLQLQDLEARKAELIEQNEAIQRRIADAKSEETIRAYAESQGMVQNGQ